MKINLAGHNIDTDVLLEYRHRLPVEDHIDHDMRSLLSAFTPETISAAYARISRAPESVDELRRKAVHDVAKARKSNETIVFDYGHASVAEHAVFNFDLIDVSRLAIEAVEHSRLASYTEKSQRYVTFDADKEEFMVPFEIADGGFEKHFRDFVRETHEQYHWTLEQIKDQERPQGGSPQEDARYLTTLAVTGQLGMTVNARTLEAMVRRLTSHPLQEVQHIGCELHAKAKDVAPSLIRYCEPDPFQQQLRQKVMQQVNLHLHQKAGMCEPVKLLTAPSKNSGGDDVTLAALVHYVSHAPFDVCYATVMSWSPEHKFSFMLDVLESMDVWNVAPRCFELSSFTFELIVSASCFAQLKRHRMATLLVQDYDPSLGFTVPASIQKDAAVRARFEAVMRASTALANRVGREVGAHAAPYVLTQAHRRRVLVQMNARELYAFSRLREDGHAQWEIRHLANVMLNYAREALPLTMLLACGKDQFSDWKSKVYANCT